MRKRSQIMRMIIGMLICVMMSAAMPLQKSWAQTDDISEYMTETAETSDNAVSDTYKDRLKTDIDYLRNVKGDPGFGYEWNVMTLARYGYNDPAWYRTYYDNVVSYVKANGSPILNKKKSTENSRLILALTSIGADVSNVGGYNLLVPLADMTFVKAQGINGTVFALIALDSGKYEIPKLPDGNDGVQTTREGLIQEILNRQLEGGGWTFSGDSADPDMTGMTIQALAPYYNGSAEIKKAVDEGLAVISSQQYDDGGLASWGTVNSESCAQIICALAGIGRDADTDTKFTKNGNSVLDSILSFYDSTSGGFAHILGDDGSVVSDAMASQQAGYALVAYDRYKSGRNRLYDMTDAQKLYTVGNTSIASITSKDRAVTIKWKSAVRAKKYDVYRKESGGSGYSRLASVASTSYVDRSVKENRKYSYVIKPAAGKVQGNSNAVTVAVLAKAGVSAKNTAKGVTLSWNKIANAENYVVFRKASGTSVWKKLAATKNLRYEDRTVKNGNKYCYIIKPMARNSEAGYNVKTWYFMSKMKKCSVKSTSRASLNVTYTRNTSATGYNIIYSTSRNLKGGKTCTVKNSKTVKNTIKGLKAGKKYYIKVRSYKKVGNNYYYGVWSDLRGVVVIKK